MSPLRKHSKYDNQQFCTLLRKGKPLIISLVETNIILIFLSNTFRSWLKYQLFLLISLDPIYIRKA